MRVESVSDGHARPRARALHLSFLTADRQVLEAVPEVAVALEGRGLRQALDLP